MPPVSVTLDACSLAYRSGSRIRPTAPEMMNTQAISVSAQLSTKTSQSTIK